MCGGVQRVPWASPKRLKSHFTTNYWALTSTSKNVFSLPPLCNLNWLNVSNTAESGSHLRRLLNICLDRVGFANNNSPSRGCILSNLPQIGSGAPLIKPSKHATTHCEYVTSPSGWQPHKRGRPSSRSKTCYSLPAWATMQPLFLGGVSRGIERPVL